jgi:hypothetical protein
MPNMSYCRFQNTLKDLRECNDHLDDQNLSEDEEAARTALIKLCEIIAETSSS